MRRTSSLFDVLPGTTARWPDSSVASADACTSRRRPPLRCAVVRPVALEAAVREDRLDVEVEVDPIGHTGDRRRLPVAGGHAEAQAQGHDTDGSGTPKDAGPERESAHGTGIMLPTRRRDPRRFVCRVRNLAKNRKERPMVRLCWVAPLLLVAEAGCQGTPPRPFPGDQRPRRSVARPDAQAVFWPTAGALPPREGGRRDDAGRLLLRREQLLHLRTRWHAPRFADPLRAGAPAVDEIPLER